MRKIITLCLILFFFNSGHIIAQWSAVPFLRIAPDARAGGMGEGNCAIADNSAALYWNPAGLAFQYDNEMSFSYADWLPNFFLKDLYYNYGTLKYHFENEGITLSASYFYLNYGEFPKNFYPYESAFTIGAGWKFTDEIAGGASIKNIRSVLFETYVDTSFADTYSFDFGFLYKKNAPIFSLFAIPCYLSTGMNLSDYGPQVKYSGTPVADPLPTNLRIGVALTAIPSELFSLTYSIDFNRGLTRNRFHDENKDGVFNSDDGDFTLPSDDLPKSLFTAWSDGSGLKSIKTAMGMECWFGKPRMIALRFGWFYEDPNYGARNFYTYGSSFIWANRIRFDISYIETVIDDKFSPLQNTVRLTGAYIWNVQE